MALYGRAWSQEDLAKLHELWLTGAGDAEIGQHLKRTGKSVNAKRRKLNLTLERYPERPQTRSTRSAGRPYTTADDHDILQRFQAGESAEAIGSDYQVTRRAMECKIDRLRERQPHRSLTPRTCSFCRATFMSIWPKSIHRRCTACRDLLNETGTTFLTRHL